jgi:2,3-bisphosphoglycerate-dependent phosphoglycerate mutase
MAAATLNTPDEHRAAASQRPFSLPPGANEIIAVRHGASADAVDGRPFPLVAGRGDPPLSPAGEAQADLIAQRLRHEPVAGLYVTPLRRTHRTAAPLAQALGLEPVVISELIEVGLGDWEGGEFRLRAAAGDPIVRQVFAEHRWDALPNGEPADSIEQRIRAGITRIVADTGPDRVAVAILHGGVIGELCRQATGSRPLAFAHSDNGSITRVVVGGDGTWVLRGFNDTSHLSDRPW